MFRIFTKLHWFFRTQKTSYAIAVTILLINSFLVLVPPYMVGHIADLIMQRQIDLPYLYRSLLLLFAVILLSYAISYVWSFLLFRGSARIGYQTRGRLMRKFLVQSPIFFEKNSIGSLMGKSTNDVNALNDFAGFGVMAIADSIFYPISLILIMGLTTSWQLTLLSILPFPLLFLFSKIISKKLYTEYEKAQEAFGLMNEAVLENVSGVRVVRAYNREESAKRRFHETAKHLYEKNMRVSVLSALYLPAMRIIPGISYVIALGTGSLLIADNALTLGQLISFTVYLSLLMWPMFAFGEYVNLSEQASSAMDRIEEVFSYPEEVEDRANAIVYAGGGDIRFDNVSFFYPSTPRAVLSNIHFTLPHGQTLGVVGKIGSGKTTLVKQLLHFYPVEPQRIFLGSRALEDYSVHSVRAHIGYVPQQQTLFSRTVGENIAFGRRNATREEILRAAAIADFEKDITSLPEGIHTMAGEKGIALSGGQKQRISIARAMISDPDILILDDSLSAVDATTESNIIENIRKHRAGKTTIIVAHRLSAVAHSDLILVLDGGRIVERGTHESLYHDKGWYREQYDFQRLERDHHAE